MCVRSRPWRLAGAALWLLLTVSTAAAPAGELLPSHPTARALDTSSTLEGAQSRSLPSDPDSLDALQTGGEKQLGSFNKDSKGQDATPSERDQRVPLLPRSSAQEVSGPLGTEEGIHKPLPVELESVPNLKTNSKELRSKKNRDVKHRTQKYSDFLADSSVAPRLSSTASLSGSTFRNRMTRRSAGVSSTLLSGSLARHRHRHGHSGTPAWLTYLPDESPSENQFEEEIAQVFREVAYGGSSSSSKSHPTIRQQEVSNTGGNRIERTTALSDNAHYDYIADSSDDNTPDISSSERDGSKSEPPEEGKNTPITNNPSDGTGNEKGKSDMEDKIKLREYDHELYDMYEGHYTDFTEDDGTTSEISRRGDASAGDVLEWQALSDRGTNDSHVRQNETRTTPGRPKQRGRDGYRPVSRLSWFDALLCTNRNIVWILVNFFLGLVFFALSLLAPYRLFSLKSCTHLLPRTHFVAVHLLMFVAASFKAVYLFHLAYGSKDRIPLVLILLLTNTGFPCFSSAFLILVMMMFLTADVQVYKPKLFTVHNISIFIVMELVLCFVADIIVGCAHSKSVLVLSRLMLIVVTVIVIVFYGRKHHVVLQVSQMLKREFQGELKLLVVPAKDVSQERQMGIKHILRNRLNPWCLVMKLSAVAIAILSIIHLCHTIFLISSQIPAWAWWIFHISGCVVETLLALSILVSAALTQRYDGNFSFLYGFLVPTVLHPNQNTAKSMDNNGTVRQQRVSFSSGTESTQYTSCNPEIAPTGCDPLSRTPKAPRRRSSPVKRSATFSHAQQQHPHASALFYEPQVVPFHVHRAGSASQIPIYSPGSGSHVSVYGPNLVSRVHISCPPNDSSMLVHEGGFVRIRTQMDPHDASTHGYSSQISLRDHAQQGSIPQLHGLSAQHLNGFGRQESLYLSLSRRRRNSRGSDIHNNFDIPESEFPPSPSSRRSIIHHTNLPQQAGNHGRRESDYESLSRRRRSCRDPNVKQLNNIDKEDTDYHSLSRRRRYSGKHRLHHMNNLDRPESDYHGITTRQLSQEDNNYISHYQQGTEADGDVVPAPRRSLRESRLPPLNLYEEQCVNYRFPPYCGSPSVRHKVPNFPVSPTSPLGLPGHNTYYLTGSPGRSKRQAQFPKPFVRLGSNTSLQAEDNFYADYFPRGNPVRRNHSSAAYYPSRNVAPPSPVLADTQRYGSLRLGIVKKRQPGYVLNTNNSKLFNKYHDRYCESEEPIGDMRTSPFAGTHTKGYSAREPVEDFNSPRGSSRQGGSPSKQSNRSGSAENDWALELIKSSSILTDFYSLKRGEGKNRASREREKASEHKEKVSEEREIVPDDRENTPKEVEKECLEEQKVSQEVEKVCGDQQKASKEVEKVCGDQQKASKEVEKVCGDQQKASKEVEKVCVDQQKATEEVEKVCVDQQKVSQEIEKVCVDQQKTTEEVEKVCVDQQKATEEIETVRTDKQKKTDGEKVRGEQTKSKERDRVGEEDQKTSEEVENMPQEKDN